jgi:hypothetical protein
MHQPSTECMQVASSGVEDSLAPWNAHSRRQITSSPLRSEAMVTDAIVTTAKGLKAALASGAAHIEIQDHLDFTQHGEVLGIGMKNNTVLVIPHTVRSIRVSSSCARCTWLPSALDHMLRVAHSLQLLQRYA